MLFAWWPYARNWVVTFSYFQARRQSLAEVKFSRTRKLNVLVSWICISFAEQPPPTIQLPSQNGKLQMQKPEMRNNWFCNQISMGNKKDHNCRKSSCISFADTYIKPPRQLSTTLKKPALVQVRGQLEK